MSLLADMTACGREYKVKDISLADLGRVEIEQAKLLMPGLMPLRDELIVKGVKFAVSGHITVKTAILIETLTDLGAEVRCCSSNINSTQDHIAAAVARDSASLFAWKGETHKDYWWCISKAFNWPSGGPDFIIDGGGDLTLLINEGVKSEESFETTGQLPDPASADNVESIIRASMKIDPKKYSNMREKLVRFHSEPSPALKRVLSNFFDDINGFGQFAQLDVMTGKVAVVCGYNDVAGSCIAALKQAGARVIVYGLKAPVEGLHDDEVVMILEDHIVSTADIFVTACGNDNKNTITLAHMRKMKNNAIVCNMSSNSDEIDMFGLKSFHGVQCVTIKPQTDRWVFPDTKSGVIVLGEGRLMNLGVFIPVSFINQLIVPEELLKREEIDELINGIMSAGSTERLPLNIPQVLGRMEARARTAAIQTDMRDEAENWEEALGMELELNQLKATIHQISEEEICMTRAVDALATALISHGRIFMRGEAVRASA